MKKSVLLVWVVASAALISAACSSGGVTTAVSESPTVPVPPTPTQVVPTEVEETEGEAIMAFELTSGAFGQGESIPTKYTCDGEDISPPLSWAGPPEGTQSFTLICDDPDAPVGTWVHWVLFNVPAESTSLSEGVPKSEQLPDGSVHGENSWGRLDYGGPCPPSGTHRYFFKLYALDTHLDLQAGASKQQVLQAMEGHVLAQAELMGVYAR